jgi:hypothetical protein
MTKSATDLMHEIISSAVIDSIAALKAASKGLPNTLLRDLNAIHANTTFADLPKDVQDSIGRSVRAAFTRLLKEGYSVASGQPAPAYRPRTDSAPAGQKPGPRPSYPKRPGPGGNARPGGNTRPGGGKPPKPRGR